jgi:ribosome modulation factor
MYIEEEDSMFLGYTVQYLGGWQSGVPLALQFQKGTIHILRREQCIYKEEDSMFLGYTVQYLGGWREEVIK